MSERTIGSLVGEVVNEAAVKSGRVRQFPQTEEQVNQIVATPAAGEIMESVIVKGDLGKLSPEERSRYYLEVCKSVGLNPLTQPFSYIVLNGKLTLYALRGCTDQLRSIHKVSVEDLTETERGDVFIVTAKVRDGEGRTDMAKGAVTIGTLKGDALANMIMKAETKAKRRATLSICGLGVLDETEIETIPQAARKSSAAAKRDGDWDTFHADLADVESAVGLERLRGDYRKNVLPKWNKDWQDRFEEECEEKLAEFSQGAALAETLQSSIDAAEEVDTPTLGQIMAYTESKDWLLGAADAAQLGKRAQDNGYKTAIASLTIPQRNSLRGVYKNRLAELTIPA